jgi:hypothetical protein
MRLLLLGAFAVTSSASALAEATLWAYRPVVKAKRDDEVALELAPC